MHVTAIPLDQVVADGVAAGPGGVELETDPPALQLHQQVLDQAPRRGVHPVQPADVPEEERVDLVPRERQGDGDRSQARRGPERGPEGGVRRGVALVRPHHRVADHAVERFERGPVEAERLVGVHARDGEPVAEVVHQEAECLELRRLVTIEPAVAAPGLGALERLALRLAEGRGDPAVRVEVALVLGQRPLAGDLDADEPLLEGEALRGGPGEAQVKGPGRRVEQLVDRPVAADQVGRRHAPRLPVRPPVGTPEPDRGARVVADGVVQRDPGLGVRFGEVLRLRQAQAAIDVQGHDPSPLRDAGRRGRRSRCGPPGGGRRRGPSTG